MTSYYKKTSPRSAAKIHIFCYVYTRAQALFTPSFGGLYLMRAGALPGQFRISALGAKSGIGPFCGSRAQDTGGQRPSWPKSPGGRLQFRAGVPQAVVLRGHPAKAPGRHTDFRRVRPSSGRQQSPSSFSQLHLAGELERYRGGPSGSPRYRKAGALASAPGTKSTFQREGNSLSKES